MYLEDKEYNAKIPNGVNWSSHKKTNIGNDVWIGTKSVILSNITIGEGAIIGAGSVVVKNVEPYEIVGGVPAKHIRFRFNKEEIDNIKKLNLFDMDIYKFREANHNFINRKNNEN